MAFTDVFGGSAVSASDVAYLSYALTANTTLTWPQDSQPTPIARLMDVTTSANVVIKLPAADEVSPGEDAIFRNLGTNLFSITDTSGITVANVAPGQVVFLYLTNNETPAGTWRSVIFGVGSSLLDAASLQGLGLQVIGNTLAQAHPTINVGASTTIAAGNRANLIVWTGGVGTLTLPPTNSVGNTFFFEVRNQGTGSVALTPANAESIDGNVSTQLQPGDSAFVHASPPSNWYTVGRGRAAQFNFTQLIKTVDGGTDTLSSTEAANVVQKYVGALASDEIVVLPAVVQVYYVSNATTGAHTLTFQSPTPGSTVTVPSNQNAILFCDGTNVINTSTTIAGFTSLILAQGSPTTPPLTFSGNVNTGIFQPSSNTVAVTCGGVEVARFTTSNVLFNAPVLLSADATAGLQAVTFQQFASTLNGYAALSGAAFTGNIGVAGNINTGGVLTVSGQSQLSTLSLLGNGGADTAAITSGTGGIGVTIIGRTDGVGILRWVDHAFANQLSALAEDGSGTLIVSHGGVASASFAANGVRMRRNVTLQGSTGSGPTLSVDGANSLYFLGAANQFNAQLVDSGQFLARGNLSGRYTPGAPNNGIGLGRVYVQAIGDALPTDLADGDLVLQY